MKAVVTYGIMSLLNSALLITVLLAQVTKIYETLLYLTVQNLIAVTFYFWVIFIHELRVFLFGEHRVELDWLYYFIRERFFKFVFVLCLSVCGIYWTLYLGGDELMRTNSDAVFWTLTIYAHGIVGVYVVFELWLVDRRYDASYFYKDMIVYGVFMIAYGLTLAILAKNTEIVIYNFLLLSYRMIAFINICIWFIAFDIYLLYHYVMTKNTTRLSFAYNASMLS
jgi:hypothetical protein